MKGGLPRLAWAGVGVLLVSAVMLSLGQRETESFPSAESYGPSGARAFAELLEAHGYQVKIEKGTRPKLDPAELVLVFTKPTPAQPFSPNLDEEFQPFRKALETHLQNGGRALILPLPLDFARASAPWLQNSGSESHAISGEKKARLIVGSNDEMPEWMNSAVNHGIRTNLWQQQLVTGLRLGKGTALILYSGLPATNRFLDRAEHAKFLMSLVETLAAPGSRVVFTEASFGNGAEPSIVETIGSWANAAWQQLLVLAVVVVFTLGKRFGFPEETRSRQLGTRDFVDAVGDTMQRTRSARMAMHIMLERADAEIRIALKMPKDADRSKRDERLPEDLRRALANLEAAADDPETPTWDAARRIKRLDVELAAFLGGRRRPARRRATILS